MAELIPDDIYENIFLRLDLRSLVTCRSVSKSWKSFISGSRFTKAHLTFSYNSNGNGHKRIGEAVFRFAFPHSGRLIIGSSNGLVCITNGELLVANPYTREVKTLLYPLDVNLYSACWGFGYDSVKGDYKVVLGVMKGMNRTCFQVKSLKSNAWNVIGEVDYTCSALQFVGVLCNAAIHWVMHPKNNTKKQVILSFDLSKEEFDEIPLPDDARCKFDNEPDMRLGIVEECLCFMSRYFKYKVWVMKKYNAKESWELTDKYRYKCEYAEGFYETKHEYAYKFFKTKNDTFGHNWFIGNLRFWNCPITVESLVSPHLQAENE